MDRLMEYLKGIAFVVGTGFTAASEVADMPTWVTVVAAVSTAVAGVSVPNLKRDVASGKLTNVRKAKT